MSWVERGWIAGLGLALGCGPTVQLDDAGSTSTTDDTTTTPSIPPVPTSTALPGTTITTTVGPPDGTTTEGFSFDDSFWIPDLPDDCGVIGPEGLPGANLPYLWVASTPQGFVSKIHTQTLIEEGRYQAAPIPREPSSVSVSLSGNAAVANRQGGVSMFVGNVQDCLDPSATSTGPDDVHPFGADGCMAWHQPLDLLPLGPVAWTPGLFDRSECRFTDELLWVAGHDGGPAFAVFLLDGETGSVVSVTPVGAMGPGGSGPEAGVVDSEGNFWFTQLGPSPLVRVDATTFDVQAWPIPVPAVGLAADPFLNLWVCGPGGVARFEPFTETFQTAMLPMGDQVQGCASDGRQLWLAGGDELLMLNVDTLVVDVAFPVPQPIHAVGLDFSGFVWGISGTTLERVDPLVGSVDVAPGYVGLTTRSDMTGYQLAHVTN